LDAPPIASRLSEQSLKINLWKKTAGARNYRVEGDASTERPLVERQEPEAGFLQESDELELARKAAGGDERAFSTLVQRHMERLFRLAWSLVGNAADAEDAVQETLAGAYDGLKKFRAQSSVKTWLTQILVRQAALVRRKRKRYAAGSIEAAEGQTAMEGGSEASGRAMDLHAALERLSPEHREVLVLREFEQMSYEEMALVVGVPRGTIESRLHRARGELREKLKAYQS
jgi:RNA polymerase sigma-70 factor (ECF subfamily)